MDRNEKALEHFKGMLESLEEHNINTELVTHYRTVISALGSRIRTKTIKHECPMCRRRMMIKANYCSSCGQALEWEE